MAAPVSFSRWFAGVLLGSGRDQHGWTFPNSLPIRNGHVPGFD
jgi:hypothetical protein